MTAEGERKNRKASENRQGGVSVQEGAAKRPGVEIGRGSVCTDSGATVRVLTFQEVEES